MKYPKAIIVEQTSDSIVELRRRDLIGISESIRPETRNTGNLRGYGFYLHPIYSWVIVMDNEGCEVLVPHLLR